MTFTWIVYGPFPGRNVISREEYTNKFRKSLKVEVLLTSNHSLGKKTKSIWLGLIETIVVKVLFCDVGIIQCLFNLFYYVINGDCTHPQNQDTTRLMAKYTLHSIHFLEASLGGGHRKGLCGEKKLASEQVVGCSQGNWRWNSSFRDVITSSPSFSCPRELFSRAKKKWEEAPFPSLLIVDFVLFFVYSCSSGPRGNRCKSDNKQTTYNTFHHNL